MSDHELVDYLSKCLENTQTHSPYQSNEELERIITIDYNTTLARFENFSDIMALEEFIEFAIFRMVMTPIFVYFLCKPNNNPNDKAYNKAYDKAYKKAYDNFVEKYRFEILHSLIKTNNYGIIELIKREKSEHTTSLNNLISTLYLTFMHGEFKKEDIKEKLKYISQLLRYDELCIKKEIEKF